MLQYGSRRSKYIAGCYPVEQDAVHGKVAEAIMELFSKKSEHTVSRN